MRVSWTAGAAFTMADLSLWEEVRAEAEALFAGPSAPESALLPSGACMVTLPCGVEIEFEEPDPDHVAILRATWPSPPKGD